jgi:hypothetical protein|tara:strand:+ start:224 stop:589 length:366 start_codon:yes stop_codon:yes gene_type:complete
MKKYFYFRDVADEINDDDISASVAIPVEAICGVVPVAITTLEVYYKKEGLVQNQKLTLTVTRGKLQEVMHQIVQHINGYTHSKAPLTVMADAVTTDFDDTTRNTIFFSDDVSAVAIAAAAY